MILFFDTETTGLPLWREPSEHPGQPRVCSISWRFDGENGTLLERSTLIKPDGWVIGEDTSKIHGITTERAAAEGMPMAEVMDMFLDLFDSAKIIVGHNISFDARMMRIEGKRHGVEIFEKEPRLYCTMLKSTPIMNMAPTDKMMAAGFKKPKLEEAIKHFFGEEMTGAHDAKNDMEATARLYYHLQSLEKAA